MPISTPALDKSATATAADTLPDLLQEACNVATVGLVIVDAEHRICLWNNWMQEKSGIPAVLANGSILFKLLPELTGGRIETAIKYALEHDQPSLLSQLLNKAPFPLYDQFPSGSDAPRLQQAIHIMPINRPGQPRHCLIQITDVTASANRERLLREQALELHASSYLDGLTGIANRRRFNEYFESEYRRAQRAGTPLSLILLDIDFFKPYNDHYGHQMGDACLTKVAEALKLSLQRTSDLVARYGGEEFAVVLPSSDSAGATFLAEQLRTEIASMRIAHAYSGVAEYITISLGVASIAPVIGSLPEHLLRAADCALYEAKAQGRNRCVTHSEQQLCDVEHCTIDTDHCVFQKNPVT